MNQALQENNVSLGFDVYRIHTHLDDIFALRENLTAGDIIQLADAAQRLVNLIRLHKGVMK